MEDFIREKSDSNLQIFLIHCGPWYLLESCLHSTNIILYYIPILIEVKLESYEQNKLSVNILFWENYINKKQRTNRRRARHKDDIEDLGASIDEDP